MGVHTQETIVLALACLILGFIIGASFGDILHWHEGRKLRRKYQAAIERNRHEKLRVLR